MAESSSKVEPPLFRFNNLPAELKLIIIKAALPEQRIFHVSGSWMDKYEPNKSGPDMYGFTFYYRHQPLALLSVCSEMRAAVLQCGVFLDSLRGARGAFFVPAIDMLYFDKHHAQRYFKRWYGGCTDADAARWATIRHVGIECLGRHPDLDWDLLEQPVWFIGPFVPWERMLATMCVRMPVLQSVTYVMPMWQYPIGELPRLDGITYVLPKSRGPGEWRRTSERRCTARFRTCAPRRNWCRCRSKWWCPVTFFETWSGYRSRQRVVCS